MKLLLYLNFSALTFYSITAKDAQRELDYFIPLIIKTRKFYSSSAVIFAHTADGYGGYGDLYSTHVVHTWSRILGRERIATLDVNFKSMYKAKRYFLSSTKPLIVVILPHPEALFEFSNATKTLKMSFPKWLVIFLETPSNEEHNHCHEPVGNPFNLPFNVGMLVLCHDDNVLREWYSVDGNTTEIFELATYDPLRGIVLRTNLSLYDRRKDLKGTIIRVVEMRKPAFYDGKNVRFKGYFGQVFTELAQALNFSTKVVHATTQYGSFDPATHSWTGAIGQFAGGHADMGVGGFTMTSDRLEVAEFLVPLMVSRECLFIKKPDDFHMQWTTYFETFSPTVWLSISTIIMTFPVILILIKKYTGTVSNIRSVSEEFLQVWGIFCQQSVMESSESSWLRMIYLTLLITAIVVYAAYSASLIRFLTTRIPLLPFVSIEELIENGSYELITVRDGAEYDLIANSGNPVFVALMKLMRPRETLPNNTLDAFEIICKESKVALYATDSSLKYLSTFIPCELSVIGIGRAVSLSLIVSKGSPYTFCFNHHLLKFGSVGLLNRLKVQYYPEMHDRDITFQAVEVFNVVTVFAIFGGGVLLSIVILILETLYYNYTYRKKSKNSLNTDERAPFEFLE